MAQKQSREMLTEMARVGFMGNMDVVVYTDDGGFIPHVHIIDQGTRGQEFDCCVMLDDNKYFSHGHHTDTMNSSLRKQFAAFMEEPCRFPQYKNNYEFAASMWNANNSNSYVIVKEDEEGNIIMPNYRTIKDDDINEALKKIHHLNEVLNVDRFLVDIRKQQQSS